MNISKAFIERNRLKKFIAEKSQQLQYANIFHMKDEGDRSWNSTNGVTIDDLLKTVTEAKSRLADFNIAIDAANAKGGRKLLDELEGMKAVQATYKGLNDKISTFKEKELMISEGQQVVVERVLDVDADSIHKALKEISNDIEKKEDEISVFNVSTEVELSEELKSYLVSYKK